MRRPILALMFALRLAGAASAQTAADPRRFVDMPQAEREFLLKEMRGLFEKLDKLTAALAEGDMKGAAAIARAGLSIMGADHKPTDPNPARYAPPEFLMMGKAMHDAGADLARAAGASASPPSPTDYKATLGALSLLTSRCVGCHGTFRIR